MVEEVRFDENMVTSVDWESYPVLHMDGLPERIDIVLIRRPEEAPSGAAEMALGLVPAAIGNAMRRDRRATAVSAVHARARESCAEADLISFKEEPA